MIQFKPITIDDRSIITRYTLSSEYRNCDFAFANMCAWQKLYNTEYSIVEDTMFIRFCFPDGTPAYMLPIGGMSWENKFSIITEDVAMSCSEKFKIMGISPETLIQIENNIKTIPFNTLITYSDNYSDYIYNRADLARLIGKKYQPKRNHINRFMKEYPRFRCERLSSADCQKCLDFTDRWIEKNKTGRDIKALNAEREAIAFSLMHFDELGLTGMVLWVENTLVAYTYGSPVNYDTYDIHVEKADDTYVGAYAMINKEFACNIPEQYHYINREEDLGIPGLRQAKHSYHQIYNLPKGVLYLSLSMMSSLYPSLYATDYKISTDSLRFTSHRMALDDANITELQNLWQASFYDSQDFLQLYFSSIISKADIFVIKYRNIICSMLYGIPYICRWGNQQISFSYWAGLATNSQYRGKGLMTKLMQDAIEFYSKGDIPFVALIPADMSLVQYYREKGFDPLFYRVEHHYKVYDSSVIKQQYIKCPALDIYTLYRAWLRLTADRHTDLVHTYDDFRALILDFEMSGGNIVYTVDSNSYEVTAITFVSRRTNDILLHDIAMTDNSYFQPLLAQIYRNTAFDEVCLFLPDGSQAPPSVSGVLYCTDKTERVMVGMARIFDIKPLLQMYVKNNPDENCTLYMEQNASPGCGYALRDGIVSAIYLSIDKYDYQFTQSEFLDWIFRKNNMTYPFMSLMFSDDSPARTS